MTAPALPPLRPPISARAVLRAVLRATSRAARPARSTRLWLWVALVALLLVMQSLLVVLTLRYEEALAQERTEEVAVAATGEIRRQAQRLLQGLQGLQRRSDEPDAWPRNADALLRKQPELGRVERRDGALRVVEVVESPFRDPLFAHWPRAETDLEVKAACGAAQREKSPVFAPSRFVPMAGGQGAEVVDVCVPMQEAGRLVGFTVATLVLPQWLEEVRGAELGRRHELSFVEGDGTRLARSGAVRGAGVFVAERRVDLPGAGLQLRAGPA